MPQLRNPVLVHITTVAMTLGFFEGQLTHMRKHGLIIHCVAAPDRFLQRFGTQEGVQVHSVRMARRITPLQDIFSVIQLVVLLRSIRPDIVHAHTPKGGLLGMIAAWLAGVPVRIYHIHGLPYVTARGLKQKLLLMTERISCSLAHQVLCVSRSIRELAIGDGVCSESKSKVLAEGSINGVDAEDRFNPERWTSADRASQRRAYGIPSEAIVIGFVGRVVRDKGFAELLQAWDILKREFQNLHLLVVGPIEAEDPIPDWALDQLQNDPTIHWAGHLEDVAPAFMALDVLAFPSYREGFGMVAIEASAMRVPVVATDIPGVVDSVRDGVSGVLVPPGDVQRLANALRAYIQSPDLRREHGWAGRNRVLMDFRRIVVWQSIYDEYIRLLGRRHNLGFRKG